MHTVVILCLLGLSQGLPAGTEIRSKAKSSCGYDSCNQHQADVLNVHLVAHTHDDVGWLKTVDQYFYGTRNNIQHVSVQYILDSVVSELWKDPRRRFIYVESFFFSKWWNKQSDEVKEQVRTLVTEGRLQFTGGAWSMNDEAAAHYQSTIDQFTLGLGFLNDTFGKCGLPTVGWQIDPFGHSREFASLLAAMGYDGLFHGRIDYQDKTNRMNKTTMEMLWRGDDDLGKPSDLFTGVLYNMYQPPPGFCFDIFCSDTPIVDDRLSPEYNVERRISEFLEVCANISQVYSTNNILITMGEDFQYQDAKAWYTNLDKLINLSKFLKIVGDMAKAFKTNNILVTMGDDFNYQDATSWFSNLDRLIEYTNIKAGKDGLKVKLFYSTPQCYLKAVKDANPTLPTKQDDFFPYASEPHKYWTGYFTSRPTTKYLERQANRYLQMAKQLQVLAGLEEHNMFVINELKGAMGMMQHHDAITGTEKQHVASDYVRILDDAIYDSLIVPRQAFNKFMQGDANKEPIFTYDRCYLNESSCATSEKSDQFVVTLYNHLAWEMKEPVRIPVVEGGYEVYAPNAEKIASQLVEIPTPVLKIPTRTSIATHEVVFIAHLHPLSYKSFYIKKVPKEGSVDTDDDSLAVTEIAGNQLNEAEDRDDMSVVMVNEELPLVTRYPDDLYLENQHMKIRANPIDQVLAVTRSRPEGLTTKFKIQYSYYQATNSGAYIFSPDNTAANDINEEIDKGAAGDVVKEMKISGQENVYSSVRLYDGLDYIENDWVVGPIEVTSQVGKEIVVRYETDIVNNGQFYTDSNGRQMLKRKLGSRPQWNVTLDEPVSGNYYPIVNKISIQDEAVKVSVVTDRSEGGSSLEEGQIEVMLHRRLVNDDGKGVDEALNETVLNGTGLVVRGTHRILLSKLDNKDDSVQEKKSVIEVDIQPQVFVSDAKGLSLQDWLKLKNGYSWANALPDGLHLLTLEPWKDNTLLLRLENYLELSDRQDSTIEIDLRSIFKTLTLESFKETTLAANRWLKDVKPWSWNTQNEFDEIERPESQNAQDDSFKIKIKAKQIRSFVVEYKLK